jgi:O-antigen/teichoic acid export membrane protein
MEELDIASVTKRSIKGILALTSRTFTIQLVSFATNLVLTIFLSPAIFGVYFVVTAAIAFLSYFSDIGLAAALIQKKEPIKEEELKATFTLQQILVVTVVVIAFLISGKVGTFYHLDRDGVLLFQALVASFFLSSLKTIPSIILERNLRFEKLVIPQIIETLFFSVTAVALAVKGFGIMSFTYAVLARGLSGVIAIYIINPWKIGFGFSKDSLKKLLSFGVPFQANSFLALVKDDLLIVYLGKVLPLSQVGFIGFAQKWAFFPLRLVMDNVIRVTFPSFSRLQNEKEALKKAVEKSIFAACFIIFPSLIGLVIFSPYLIHLIPKYLKWEPALISLAFFSLNAGLSSISTPLTNALNAIGKIKITLRLMIFWTVLTWALTPLAIFLLGFNGVAIVSALVAFSLFIVIYVVRKYINFSLTNSVKGPFISALIMGIFMYFLSILIVKDFWTLIIVGILSVILYIASMFVLARRDLILDIKFIKDSLKKHD